MIYFALFLICMALFFSVVIYRDTHRFTEKSYEITSPKLKKDLKIMLAADLHNQQYRKNNEKLKSAILAMDPDGVLVAGDLPTAVPGHSPQPAIDFVQFLTEKYPVWYGNGNHESRMFSEKQLKEEMGTLYRESLQKMGVRHLENTNVFMPELNIRIYGLDLKKEWYRKFQGNCLTKEDVEALLGKPDPKEFNILIAHHPAYFEAYRKWGADLVVSGHVHGGVMRLPILGGVLSTTLHLFPKYDGGLFAEEGSTMIVSRGLGVHTVPIRVFNPAELIKIQLKKGEADGFRSEIGGV